MKKDQVTNPQEQGTTIDWGEIRRRVETAQGALAQSAEEKRSILRARARALAQEPQKAELGESTEIIEFLLASETYAIESAFVREVYPLTDFTPLPGTPPFVLGIINVRGQILSVVDLKKFFNLPEKGLGDLNKVIIIRNDRMEFGILADVILGTRLLLLDEIQLSPATVAGIGAEYLKGVTGAHVIVLDAENILGDEKIVVRQVVE